MAEEQRLQEGHRLCANNCGFFGSPATLNLCSECYRDHRLKEEEQQQQLQAAVTVEKSLLIPSSASAPDASSSTAAAASEVTVLSVGSASPPVPVAEEDAEKKDDKKAAPGPSRCASCRKRVGLTGFRCRCGSTYCGAHRYAEQHGCTFDFKAAGRAAIARANPVVKGEKLRKI